MKRAAVCIGTYNEAETLPSLVARILEIAAQLPHVELQILVVDDNSPDGTGTWCDQFAQERGPLTVLHRSGKLGLGTAMIEALRWTIDADLDYAITMDADWSHDPAVLPELFAALNEADVVIGSRYIPAGRIINWPVGRRVLSAGANLVARALLGLKPRDCSSGYRAYRVEGLRQIDLTALRASGYLFYEEVLAHLQSAKQRIVEIPITFTNRQRGKSKIGVGEVYRAATTLMRVAWKRRLRREP